MEPAAKRRRSTQARPRVSQACSRCRRHKIKCDGYDPCNQCNKRGSRCEFDATTPPSRLLPDQQSSRPPLSPVSIQRHGPTCTNDSTRLLDSPAAYGAASPSPEDQQYPLRQQDTSARSDGVRHHNGSASSTIRETDSTRQASLEPALQNPLLPGNSPASHTANAHGKQSLFMLIFSFYGTTSNWSFARRALSMIYQENHAKPMPPDGLLFEGATYELGWDGRRDSSTTDKVVLPTSDYALFLIDAVKFHCGSLFHVFDEETFMQQLDVYQSSPDGKNKVSDLWQIHYLMILAFGKAFIMRSGKERTPPGSEFFVPAMKMLPDFTYLFTDPPQAIEIFVCAALYLQCIDFRSAAHNMIGQALRLALEQGMHTDEWARHLSPARLTRYRKIWWTVYILDRRISSLLGSPISIADNDITTDIPTFQGNYKKSLALKHHIELCKATSAILLSVYNKDDDRKQKFLESMKSALRAVAEGSAERHEHFPLDLSGSPTGVSRQATYLHLFEQQCLILATRPLLFLLLKKRLACTPGTAMKIDKGMRKLLKVCVSSAQKTIKILKTLQDQGLLDSFLPFDREASFSSATVLSLTGAVDQTLLYDDRSWLKSVYSILDEMTSRGNRIARFHKTELEQLNANVGKILACFPERQRQQMPMSSDDTGMGALQPSVTTALPEPGTVTTDLLEWGNGGEEFLAAADCFDDFTQLGGWNFSGELDTFQLGF